MHHPVAHRDRDGHADAHRAPAAPRGREREGNPDEHHDHVHEREREPRVSWTTYFLTWCPLSRSFWTTARSSRKLSVSIGRWTSMKSLMCSGNAIKRLSNASGRTRFAPSMWRRMPPVTCQPSGVQLAFFASRRWTSFQSRSMSSAWRPSIDFSTGSIRVTLMKRVSDDRYQIWLCCAYGSSESPACAAGRLTAGEVRHAMGERGRRALMWPGLDEPTKPVEQQVSAPEMSLPVSPLA